MHARFLDGLASATELDRGLLDGPGTTVIGRDDRADSKALACYHSGQHLVIWGDPAVIDRAAALAGPTTLSEQALAESVGQAGFGLHASLINHMLDGPPVPPADLLAGYLHRWLDGDDPTTLAAVTAFTERCDADDVDAAGLDELDEFDEDAINVLTPAPAPAPAPGSDPGPSGLMDTVVAYASASKWEWDPEMADIGVLVDAGHRRKGLAHLVVAHTVQRLIADGRVPFYRHMESNTGSTAVAASIGFRPVARLNYFVLAED